MCDPPVIVINEPMEVPVPIPVPVPVPSHMPIHDIDPLYYPIWFYVINLNEFYQLLLMQVTQSFLLFY